MFALRHVAAMIHAYENVLQMVDSKDLFIDIQIELNMAQCVYPFPGEPFKHTTAAFKAMRDKTITGDETALKRHALSALDTDIAIHGPTAIAGRTMPTTSCPMLRDEWAQVEKIAAFLRRE
jgi:hypothetical protein